MNSSSLKEGLGLALVLAMWVTQIAWFGFSFYWVVWGSGNWIFWGAVWLFFVEPFGAMVLAWLFTVLMFPFFLETGQ